MVDHSIHGLVTIRMEDPPTRIVDELVRLLGPSTGRHKSMPDVSIRFVDRFPEPEAMRWLNRREAAYDDEHFYVADSDGSRMRVDLAALGEPLELVCERSIATLPLLLPLLGLRLLRLGHVLLHSAAFAFQGVGVLAVGWKKGGKTELMLPFMSAGATHVADEWSILSSDRLVSGLAGQVQVWSWHLRQSEMFWERVPANQRRRIRALRAYQRMYTALPMVQRRRSGPYRVLRQLATDGSFARLGQARATPDQLFAGRTAPTTQADVVLLAGVGSDSTTAVRRVPVAEVASRMTASLAYERNALVVAHEQFRFAFPARASSWLGEARAEEAPRA